MRRHKTEINNFKSVCCQNLSWHAQTLQNTQWPTVVVYIFVVAYYIFHAAKPGARTEFYEKYLPQIFFSFQFSVFLSRHVAVCDDHNLYNDARDLSTFNCL